VSVLSPTTLEVEAVDPEYADNSGEYGDADDGSVA
jgi:hypothetical protein